MRLSHLWCEHYWKVCWSGVCLPSDPFYALLLSSLLKEGQLCRLLFVGSSDSQFPLSLGSPMGNTKREFKEGWSQGISFFSSPLLVLLVEAVSFVASMPTGLACHNSSIHCVTLALGSCSGIFFCLSWYFLMLLMSSCLFSWWLLLSSTLCVTNFLYYVYSIFIAYGFFSLS